jgi:hypothetical protein
MEATCSCETSVDIQRYISHKIDTFIEAAVRTSILHDLYRIRIDWLMIGMFRPIILTVRSVITNCGSCCGSGDDNNMILQRRIRILRGQRTPLNARLSGHFAPRITWFTTRACQQAIKTIFSILFGTIDPSTVSSSQYRSVWNTWPLSCTDYERQRSRCLWSYIIKLHAMKAWGSGHRDWLKVSSQLRTPADLPSVPIAWCGFDSRCSH